ncbi:intracellular hyaluronan-binding protein 4 [Pelobates fuscus]|uniref:intracellular hyaluronan-binding protein 4 n=1 Tax=Pelobates fuscus TaxID=191477 RepID=UPI002FE4D480
MLLGQMKQIHIEPDASRMEEAFGCAVENRFNRLLDDETDPLEFLQKAAEEKSRRKKKQTVAKNDGKKESQRDRKAQFAGTNTEVQNKQTGQKQPPKPQQSGNPAVKTYKPKTEQKPFEDMYHCVVENPTEHDMEYRRMETVDKEKLVKSWLSNRGGTRGKGRGGFSRITEQDTQRGKREFDRHSGSGRGGLRAEDKRGGSGSHNWGSIQDECSAVESAPVEEYSENHKPLELLEEENVKVTDELAAEELAEEMTLDEWKCRQEQNRAKPEFNLRKPASSVPSKAVVIHKSKYRNNMENEEDLQYVCRRPINDITAQLDINFGSLSRPGRGGRGGGRGRVRREEPFSHAMDDVYTIAPDPDDFVDFPALS